MVSIESRLSRVFMQARFLKSCAIRSARGRFTRLERIIIKMNTMSEYSGLALFALAPVLLSAGRAYSQTRKEYSKDNIGQLIAYMERLVQEDQGNRGIGQIVLPTGELQQAARTMIQSNKVAIITGFPCLLKHNPPTETDGPLGALALAKCLLALGKDVVIATDECNEEVLLACSQATMAHKSTPVKPTRIGRFSLESFPASTEFGLAEESRLEELKVSVDLVIAIERAGPCQDGRYLTMRGYDMTHIVAPLEMLLMPPEVMEEVELSDPTPFGCDESLIGSPQDRPVLSAKAPKSIGIGKNTFQC